MRKTILSQDVSKLPETHNWLDLEAIADVEISSEDAAFPIEGALVKEKTTGWRAGTNGPQTIRLVFHTPQKIRRIHLHIVDKVAERSQEFLLLAFVGDQQREIARQQWNFSPQGTTEEIEDYQVELEGVTALELKIDPDRSHDPKQSQHAATIKHLRVA